MISHVSCHKNPQSPSEIPGKSPGLSRWVDWSDRGTCVLFGDGAGAMLITAAESENDVGCPKWLVVVNGYKWD
jgi:hypothetical protein